MSFCFVAVVRCGGGGGAGVGRPWFCLPGMTAGGRVTDSGCAHWRVCKFVGVVLIKKATSGLEFLRRGVVSSGFGL